LVAAQAMTRTLEAIKQQGTPISVMSQMTPFKEFVASMGFADIRELERRFGSKP